jgi:hypothetical protein
MIIDRFKSDIVRLQEIARSLEDEYDEEMVSEWAEERNLMVIDTNISGMSEFADPKQKELAS